MNDESPLPDYLGGSPDDDESEDDYGSDPENQFEELSARIEKLESETKELKANRGITLWSLGMAIAVVLSWSRNASILWCLLHGVLSWGYVIYFALTRH